MGNPYRIGIEFMMAGNLRHMLGVVIADMGRMLLLQNRINNSLAQGGRLAAGLWGVGGVMAGTAGVKFLSDMSSHADKLLNTMKQMENQGWWRTSGVSQRAQNLFGRNMKSDLSTAHDMAFQLSGKYPTMGYNETLEMIKEMAPVLGTRQHSMEIAEMMTKFGVVLQGTMGDKGNIPEQLRSVVKALELKGVMMDPKTGELKLDLFSHYVSGMAQTMAATSGFIKPSDYLQFMKQARASGMLMDEDFFLRVAPTLMQEMGSLRAGTGMMAMFQALIGGQLTKRSADVLAKQGVISQDEADSYGREGLTAQKFGTLLAERGFMNNPYTWFQKIAKPLLEEKHGGAIDRVDFIKEMAQWFGNRTAQAMADVLITQGAKISRDQKLIPQARSLDETVAAMLTGNPMFAKRAMDAQQERAWVAIAESIAPLRADVLMGLANMFNSIANFANANPDAIRSIAEGLGILSVALIGGGAVAIMAALGPAGWIAAGVIGLAGVLAANRSTFMDWADRQKNTWSDAWKNLGEVMAGAKAKVTAAMTEIGQALIDGIGSLPGRVYNEISSAIGKIADYFNSQLSRLWEGLKNLSPISAPGGGVGGGAKNSSWEPSGEGRATNVHNVIYLDGKVLARSTARHLSDSWRFPRTAPYHDGMRDYSDPGQQLVFS